MSLRIMLAEDHEMVRRAFVQFINMEAGFEVVAEAASSTEVFEMLAATEIDILLMDYGMPGVSGVELISQVRQQYPNLPILVLTAHDDIAIVSAVMQAGASGYINKRSSQTELFEAIELTLSTGRFLSPEMAQDIAFSRRSDVNDIRQILSERELQVCGRLVAGKEIGEISADLGISVKTVSTHKANLLHKLNLKSVVELVKYCIDNKIVF